MNIQQILKSKTMLFAIALAVFGVLEANAQLLSGFIPPEYYGSAVTMIGIIVAVLRVLTTAPLSEK